MLTKVLLIRDERRRVRLFFGEPLTLIDVQKGPQLKETHALFRPHSILGLEVWRANEYGTVFWRLFVLRTVSPGEKLNRIPEVLPGAEILFAAKGERRVREAKAWLKDLVEKGVDPARLDPDYYRSAWSKMRVNLKPRDFSKPHGKVLSFLKRRG